MPPQLDLDKLLRKLPTIHVGVVGDFCLDAYWEVDNSRSEQSVETGLPTRPVRVQRYSLGGAGNVARAGATGAAALIMISPTIIIFLIMQSRVLRTMAYSGIKA